MTCQNCKNGLTAGGQVCSICGGTGKVQEVVGAGDKEYSEGQKVDFKPGCAIYTSYGTFVVGEDQKLVKQ